MSFSEASNVRKVFLRQGPIVSQQTLDEKFGADLLPTTKDKEENRHLNELKEMLVQTKEPKEKVLAVFCHRHGISMADCEVYYEKLVAKGDVKGK